MKYKLSVFLLVLLMILLLGGIGIFGYIIYMDISSTDSNENISKGENNIAIRDSNEEQIKNTVKSNNDNIKKQEENVNISNNIGNKGFFYEQLDDAEKIMYDGLQENKERLVSGNYVIQYGNKFTDILKQENGSTILGDKYQAAIDAFVADNPDLFYIEISKLYINIETSKKTFSTSYNVYIGPENGKTYYNDSFSNEKQVRDAISEIEKIKDELLAKMTNSEYKNIKLIHDFIVDTAKYDENYESKNTYTIYGALIDHKCVCEGYAKALKYLANEAGISCEIIKGSATNSTGVTEKHAWNCVKVDGKWYYMDITWDDPIVIGAGGGEGLSTTSYKYFLKGANNFEGDHIAENVFSTNGKKFTYPEVSHLDY